MAKNCIRSFSYARDFLQNGISVKRLTQVMKLGNPGNQIVLVSETNDLSKAQGETLLMLAKALNCTVENLLK